MLFRQTHFLGSTWHSLWTLLQRAWYKRFVHSMTGYGRGQSEQGDHQVTVEIRSVNHRFLDLKLRGTNLGAPQEATLRKLIGKKLTRGSVNVSIRLSTSGGQSESQIDPEAAKRAYTRLQNLGALLGLSEEPSIALICNQPGVMRAYEADEDETLVTNALVEEATMSAVEDLQEMRFREGESLKKDLEARAQTIATLAEALGALAKLSPAEVQVRLQERIDRLLKHSKVEVDAARLAQEVAIAADRLDVTEELVRIASHLEQIHDLAGKSQPVGRKLDFLVQELGREFNTITSKSQSAKVSAYVVEAKAEMEKIREQVQNIE